MLERFGPYVESRLINNQFDPDKVKNFISKKIIKHYIEKYKLLKLKNIVTYCYNNSSFYHKSFKNKNIKPSDIKSFIDINTIPFTDSEDIKNPESFFCVPASQFVKIFSSTGTTGKSKMVFFTKDDLKKQISTIRIGLGLLYNISKEDVVRVTYDHGYSIYDWGVRFCMERALEKVGSMSILTGSRLSTEDEIQLFKTYNVSILMGTTSYIHSLSCDMENQTDLTKFNIKKILVGTEPLPKILRKKLENIWNTDVLQGYGLAEMGTSVAGECKEKNGMHISESDFFCEVIDAKTGEVLEDGEEGEIVITTLSREGMPLLRYRTRDLGVILPEKCACGLPFKRIKIKGRTDDMIIIGSGDKIYPDSIDDAILSVPSVINYQIIFKRKDNKDYIQILIESNQKTDIVKKQIEKAILSIPEIYNGIFDSKTIYQPEIKILKPHTFDKNSIKAKKIIDNRNLYD